MLFSRIIVVWILLVGLGLLSPVTLFPQTKRELPIYQDPSQPMEVRAEDLLLRMTLKEKVGQLNRPAIFREQELRGKAPGTLEDLKRFAAGTYTEEIGPGSGFLGFPDPILPAHAYEQAELYNALQAAALGGTRLKIPLLEEATGTHGVPLTGCTIFPEGLAIGSSWDMDLVKAVYAAVAQEARALGIHELDTLVIEPNRDPRLGRNSEGYSEDPYMCSRIAESIVHGIQGDNVAAKDKAVAMLCHYPGQSQPVSGLERGAMEISERALREWFLPPWVAGIKKAGALGVMATYPEIDDTPAHGSEKLLTMILREELGFQGLVISEGYGFKTLLDEGIVSTQKEAGALALRAGVDINLTYEPAYMKPLIENVEEGRVSIGLVDRAVRRVLLQKLRLGLFENPYVDPTRASQVVHSLAHEDLALRAGREGIVLLKNEKQLLPLTKDVKSIAVIGPDADEPRNQLGDYISPTIPQHIVTVLEGIKAQASTGAKVVYARGCNVLGDDKSGFAEAIQAAREAEVAVVVVGEKQTRDPFHGQGDRPTDGEGADVASLDLSGVQEDLVRAIYETGTPTVVVLINGRPLSIRWTAEHVRSIVEAWEPGERGGEAVAQVLFGDYNPSGRLPITVPRHSGQLPDYYNYKPSKASRMKRGYVDMPATPLYPFGYGLSYTTFEYSHLRIEPPTIHPAGKVQVSVDVKNVGDRAGEETPQLYVHELFAPVSTPVKQLRAFEKVPLAPGETKAVTFTLTPEDLQILDPDMHWVVEPGTFEIMVGSSSEDIREKGILAVKE